MCGIAVILKTSSRGEVPARETSIPDAWLDALESRIAHRGPDEHGRFRDRVQRPDGSTIDVALVHRRLTILDARGGQQPMVVADPRGQCALVFNGCIYNHRDLRRSLMSSGVEFRSDHSDTEVLLLAWKQWGPDAFARLEGMFACAIWDGRTGDLLLARDRVGEKPLYWCRGRHQGASVFAIASTPTGLQSLSDLGLTLQRCSNEPPGESTRRWLRFGYSETDPTGVIANHPPAHWSIVAPSGPQPTPFSNQRFEVPPARNEHLDDDRVDRLLATAVASRLESDVPLGCFLSGGIDSSLIAANAMKAAGSLQTFSVRMPDARLDESRFAQTVADHLHTTHSTLDCEAHPAEDLTSLIQELGLPFGDSSLLPTYWVSRAARRHVKVALSGDGGDELFGGYDRHRAARYVDRLPAPLRAASASLAAMIPANSDPRSRRTRAARFAAAAARDGYRDLCSIFPTHLLDDLLGPCEAPDPQVLDGDDAVSHALWNDFHNYLPGDLLRKTDTASMSVALEVRCPFLESSLIAAAQRCPISQLMPGGVSKGLLRRVATRHLPVDITKRRKQGFAIPLGDWFRSNQGGLKTLLIDAIGSADPFPESRLGISINRRYVERLVHDHMLGLRDHAQRLYVLMVMAMWARG
ncbi:MAG: asparagine synthase (glutamine-hydrolyzing) [Planctomycetes bacterium]|nr:asparagine synthase (glutamine-hydrolyzing) [Planctomycetota bacterium]